MTQRTTVGVALGLALLLAPAFGTAAKAAPPLPSEMSALGDSFTRAWDGMDRPAASWSTGTMDYSHYSRLVRLNPSLTGNAANYAQSGSKMAATAAQADSAVTQGAQYITILSGTNDVCRAQDIAGMTSVQDYTTQLRATISKLAAGLPGAEVFVATNFDLYGHWLRFKDDPAARDAWAANNVCPLIFGASTPDADRQAAGQRLGDYNAAIDLVCAEFERCTDDDGAVFKLALTTAHLAFDYFHLSEQGQERLATVAFDAGPYGSDVPQTVDSSAVPQQAATSDVSQTADTTPPELTLAAKRRMKLGAALQRGYAFRASCSEPCDLLAQLRLEPKLANWLKLPLVVGQARKTLSAVGPTRIIVKLNAKAKRKLKSLRKVPLQLVTQAMDAAGSARTIKRKVVLRR